MYYYDNIIWGDFYLSGVDGEDFNYIWDGWRAPCLNIWGGRRELLLYLGWMERTSIISGVDGGDFYLSGVDGRDFYYIWDGWSAL